MSLSTGERLGPYEIYGLIGKGGMGEVYRARDTRLDRTVAIKVLPAEFSVQEERLRRFEQEAQVLGALSHPNLLAIYDVGAQDGTHFLVSELLEGESLRQRLEEGALPLRKAMELGVQIAKGLAAAHEKGIVHRDIKPDNIFLTRDGRAKILDFGLAKQSGATAAERTRPSPRCTQPGVVLGTAGYMSPEQVRGKPADARSDIFSFGAILYEMVAGLRAFQCESSVETMNAILKQDPPAISGDVPPAIERVIRRCLEKAPDERFQSARDLSFALEALSAPSSSTSTREAAIPALEKRRWPAMLLLAVAALALGAGGVFAVFKLRSPIAPSFRQLIFGRGFIETARFTPDGQNVVYGASWNGKPFEIFTTGLDGLESRSLGLPPANILGIGANGQMAVSLGMHHTQIWMTSGTLAEVSLTGGAPRPLLENVCDGDMSPDGKRMAIVRCSGARRDTGISVRDGALPHHRLYQQCSGIEGWRYHRFRGASHPGRRSRIPHAGGLTGKIEAPHKGMGVGTWARLVAFGEGDLVHWERKCGAASTDGRRSPRNVAQHPEFAGLFVAARHQRFGQGAVGRHAAGRRHRIPLRPGPRPSHRRGQREQRSGWYFVRWHQAFGDL